mgnify:CR=1 FL=1
MGGLSDFVDGMCSVQAQFRNVDIILTTCSDSKLKLFDNSKKYTVNFKNFEFISTVYSKNEKNKNIHYIDLDFIDSSIQSAYSENEDQAYLQLMIKSLVATEIINEIKRLNSKIICHEWPTSFLFLHKELIALPMYFIVHNFQHQGPISLGAISNLPKDYRIKLYNIYEKYNYISMSHFAIHMCDKLITVSNNYLNELQNGFSLHPYDDIFKMNSFKSFAVVNPVKKNFMHNYKYKENIQELLDNKKTMKDKIKNDLNIKQEKLIVFISRPCEQKGFHLFLNEKEFWFYKKLRKLGYAIIFYGDSGVKITNFKIKKKFEPLLKKYDHIKILQDYNDEYASQLFLAADIQLMPSLYEPCGLSQQYAMLNGTIPIVNPVGGLKETVINESESSDKGTGFWIDEYNLKGILDKILEANIILLDKVKKESMIHRMLLAPKYWDDVYEKYQSIFDDKCS